MSYQIVSDEYINNLFKGTTFGPRVDSSVTHKRALIAKTLQNQLSGFWSGNTIYHIVVDGGFLHDAKQDEKKRLTALGVAFLETHEKGTHARILDCARSHPMKV